MDVIKNIHQGYAVCSITQNVCDVYTNYTYQHVLVSLHVYLSCTVCKRAETGVFHNNIIITLLENTIDRNFLMDELDFSLH